ncbi:hypothetical protein A6E15_18370 [Natrinema saccharevitans]|uniref:Uncharacterized protein n=1 Tax=Natrinema saccharevitans TaxID=301967 RepID=A0A1S8AS08_9EURY|nr:hypothetical protein [Natrinema saccharevitans]OLZ39347.1 hypothetical protein A6E15_18370 [Natrinema saccharevitans]
MSNPFDDLKEDDEETETADSTTETETEVDAKSPSGGTDEGASEPTASDSSPNRELDPEPPTDTELAAENATGMADEPESPAEAGPAFEYSEVQQKPFYARSETVDEFENAIRTTIVPTLAEADVIDEETREIHDAVLRLANEEPERIAELVLEERRQAGDH